MKYLKLFLLGVIPLLYAGYRIHADRQEVTDKLRAFCQATHVGEPWAHVLERAREQELEFLRANASTEKVEEHLASVEAFTYRFGCRVGVKDGLVVSQHAKVLPAQ